MKLTTAGESHGKALVGIIEGLPSNLKLNIDEINGYLALRQGGYGRGARQQIEKDEIEILSGVRNRITLGSPVSFAIKNADYENWREYIAPEGADTSKKTLTAVRPGHADLAGCLKFSHSDARNVLERASARETAVRVAAGSIARQYLREIGVEISGFVKCVCGISDGGEYSFDEVKTAKSSPLFMLDKNLEEQAIKKIELLKECGDTAGGIAEIRIKGLKSGFGSCMTYAEKLDARLCGALMSVQSVKGVEVGVGFLSGMLSGSEVHDEIFYGNGKYFRKTNRAGGIEGGMSNGEEIVLRVALKPIPTLKSGLKSVDIVTKQATVSAKERGDVTAVCAAEIILESVAAFTVANVVSERLGGDSMNEVIKRYDLLP